MSDFSYEDLEKLAATIETITFKEQPVEGEAKTGYLPAMNEELLQTLIDGNPNIQLDLMNCGVTWGLDEENPFSGNIISAELRSDGLVDSSGLDKYSKLRRLKLSLNGIPRQQDIEDLHKAIFNAEFLTDIEIDACHLEDDQAEMIEKRLKLGMGEHRRKRCVKIIN